MTQATEANFDGLVGPTHHYGGLAYGNVASAANAGLVSRPKEAALQGLAKMKALADLGVAQGVLPPQERPHLPTLRKLGFDGTDAAIVAEVGHKDPTLLEAVSSASPMWAANAATVSPSADAADGKVHLTVANLASQFHRSIEPAETQRILEATFPERDTFAIHGPLHNALGDEGAANHTRLTAAYGRAGVELFTYGRPGSSLPKHFPARQHRRASEAVARIHGLDPARTVFAQQDPDTIDRGVFHNDVIAVGNLDLLFAHERAFVNQPGVFLRLRQLMPELEIVELPESRVSVEDAVRTYLFNSQLIRAGERTVLVAPQEVRDDAAVWDFLSDLIESDKPIDSVVVFDLRQSMRNGGGPACLRLRVVLTDSELTQVNQTSLLTDDRYASLVSWVHDHYRDELTPADLSDPGLLDETRTALDALTRILGLPQIYDFQR